MTPAAFDPRDPDPAAIQTALSGRPLIASNHRTRGWCLRCQRKNGIRTELGRGTATRNPTFADGERIRLEAVGGATDDADSTVPREHRWAVARAHHRDHPARPREAVARPDAAQARLLATVRREGWVYRLGPEDPEAIEYDPNALVLRDVDVRWVSPLGHGTAPDWAIDGEGERGMTLDLAPSDPRPDWPATENAWRRELVRRHGDE